MTPTRRQFMVRRLVVLGILLIVVVTGIYVPVVLTAPLPAAAATLELPAIAVAPAATVTTPGVGSSAIALQGSADVLASSGQTGPVPIASVTKILTALVVLQAKPLTLDDNGPSITMTAADVAFLASTRAAGGSYVLVNEGQVLTERQIIDIMLLESANNYSETLVTWAFGSIPAYLDAARTFISANGLTGTNVVDSSGLDPASVSTTTDLLKLASLALANPVLAAVVSTPRESVPGLDQLDNTNTLLGTDGIDGLKTGTTDEAGSCLLFSADFTVGGTSLSVVGVVLGAATSESARQAVVALLDSTKAGFTDVPLATAGQVVGDYTTEWGETVPIVAAEDAGTVVWSSAPVTVAADAVPLAEGAAGSPAGDLRFAVDGATVTVPLRLDAALAGPDPLW
ncbi:D-alanyl-D-alanine carboxypeptidase family protein, partial [Subtercola sp. Z020]|uniref:D-alanyl-D-alanine carboxypeptidase family protein n=1 Tax=Subtercola sp. Z020 TaxID=2080582 RepID=UPI0011B061FD